MRAGSAVRARDDGDVASLGDTRIQTPDRSQARLASVAMITADRGPNVVMRENAQRRLVVQCNVAGRDLRSVVNDTQARVAETVNLPQWYRLEYGGQFEREADAFRQLLWLSLDVVVAIFLILASAFGSARDGVLVMVNLPPALTGGVVGVYLAGASCRSPPSLGSSHSSVSPSATTSCWCRTSATCRHERGVTDFRTAVVHGATERVVPILMTALATVLALVPIALSAGRPGSEIQAPMAMVSMCGLFSSTALNRVVVPILYERFARQPAVAESLPVFALAQSQEPTPWWPSEQVRDVYAISGSAGLRSTGT